MGFHGFSRLPEVEEVEIICVFPSRFGSMSGTRTFSAFCPKAIAILGSSFPKGQ